MKKLLLALALLLFPLAASAAGRLVTIDICQDYPRVVTRTGLSLNVLARMEGGCAAGPRYVTVDVCRDYPRVVSRTGLVLNVLSRSEGDCN